MDENKDSNNLSYAVRQAFHDIFRMKSLSLSALLVLALCLIVSSSFVLLMVNIRANITALASNREMMVYVDEDFDNPEWITPQIEAIESIEEYTFVSKLSALEEEKEKYADYPQVFEGIDETNNPYRDSFIIIYKEGTNQTELKSRLLAISGVARVVVPIESISQIRSIEKGTIFVFSSFGVGLIAVSIFVIFIAIGQGFVARADEIEFMSFVGATKKFIRRPFILQGLFIGLFAGELAGAITSAIYAVLYVLVKNNYTALLVLPIGQVFIATLVVSTIFGGLLGVIASRIALHKYVKG